MTKKDICIVLRVVKEHLHVLDKCKAAKGEICNCPQCQIERIDVDKLQDVVNKIYYEHYDEDLVI